MSDDVKLEVKPVAQTEFVVTDKRGRNLTIRKPPFIAQFDLIDSLGESATNSTYLSMVSPLLYLSTIDGESIARPTNKAQLRALASRLDEDGFEALVACIQANFSEKPAGEDAVKND